MKIGILTFHCAHNYGAMLQCYALQEYLKGQGDEVYVIDYRPDYLVHPYRKHKLVHWLSKNPLRMIKRFVTEPFLFRARGKRWDGFARFAKEQLRLWAYNPDQELTDFDWLLYGSDQIWNIRLTGNTFDPVFWGERFCCKKATYAVSIGWFQPNEIESSRIANYLNNFSAISVRESKLWNQLSSLTDKPISLVCDPVFLLSKIEWSKYCKPIHISRPYLLCYNLCQSDECEKQAQIICQQMGYDRIDLTPVLLPVVGRRYRQTADPLEFISYLREASYIVTSSFHGTAFSLIFRKPFYAVGMGNKADRASSLLQILGLEDRLLVAPSKQPTERLDYANVEQRLSDYVENSKNYLNTTIQ